MQTRCLFANAKLRYKFYQYKYTKIIHILKNISVYEKI